MLIENDINRLNQIISSQEKVVLYAGDCRHLMSAIPDNSVNLIITSPPYCMKKEYEKVEDDIESFKKINTEILRESIRVLKSGGSLCWQIGFHVTSSIVVPLDYIIYSIIDELNKNIKEENRLYLHNRIIWTFGHGLKAEKRLSGRYETILWYTKGNNYKFNLDAIRVPQKYPGKRYSKGPQKGKISGNPLGKNPSDVWEIIDDVWDIPNVKANHIEKTSHPCQFPVAIPTRLILALTDVNDIVLDPFSGSGSTAIACVLNNRKFIGAEIMQEYIEISKERVQQAYFGDAKIRPDVPVMEPDQRQKVAQKPKEFKW